MKETVTKYGRLLNYMSVKNKESEDIQIPTLICLEV